MQNVAKRLLFNGLRFYFFVLYLVALSLLCCFTGMAYADVNELAQEHIFTDGQGALWIKKRRKKTKVQFNVPILPPAKAIIDRYSNTPACVAKGVLLPVISNQITTKKCNRVKYSASC